LLNIATLSWQVIPEARSELTRAAGNFALEAARWAGISAGPPRWRTQMKRSYSARVKSFLIVRRKRKRLAVEVAEAACLLEKSLAKVHLNGEPELPNQYRHIRSAIGALLILGRESEF
jgi:hypothetical protein